MLTKTNKLTLSLIVILFITMINCGYSKDAHVQEFSSDLRSLATDEHEEHADHDDMMNAMMGKDDDHEGHDDHEDHDNHEDHDEHEGHVLNDKHEIH